MPNHSSDNEDLAYVAELMHKAAGVMAEFPSGFVPPDVTLPKLGPASDGAWRMARSVGDIVSDPQVPDWMQEISATWPDELRPVFVESSRILAAVLAALGVSGGVASYDILQHAMTDPDTLELMFALRQVRREVEALEENTGKTQPTDPIGFTDAAMDELRRRSIASRAPFARTITTLLGHDALLWLTAESEDGAGKLQPHEFTRTGWRNLWAIENQLMIEQELLEPPPEVEYLAKIVVGLSWTLAGLASFIQPAVFFGEMTAHLVSQRPGQYTVGSGPSCFTLVQFHTAPMLPLVRILAKGMTDPLISAADLMWIGAALARVREVQSGLGDPAPLADEHFEMFLSHRGRDAKRPLTATVQALQPAHGVFLDCLTLPRGVINRSFVYGSLAHSARILIVETENYGESLWCRKEAWMADALAAHGLARTERVTLPEAAAWVTADGSATGRRRARRELRYPVAQRVLRDLEYWARQPNLYSLEEGGHPTESLAPLRAAIEHGRQPDSVEWVLSIGKAVRETLSSVVATAPDAEPFDLWATALQLSLAAFAAASCARSKNEVRRGVDQLNAVLRSVVGSELHRDPVFESDSAGHLALIAAASAIDLAGYELDPRLEPAVLAALGDVAGVRDGLLLLDVREPGPMRSFRLRLIAALVQGNVGSVGIVQDAADEVHQGRVGALPLEILPCVTLYPGMDAPFDPARR